MNRKLLEELVKRYPVLAGVAEEIWQAAALLVACYKRGGCVYLAGNGGSAADASHIVGELMKGFLRRRPVPAQDREALASQPDGDYLAEHLQQGLPAVSLMSQEAIESAVSNDLGGDLGAAQQLYAMGRAGDVLIGISTSGNARNVDLACQLAKTKGIAVIGLTGRRGGKLKERADVCICVPEDETFKVQELHLPVYHALCFMVEDEFFAV